jgi:RNA polymerase sigma-B factor
MAEESELLVRFARTRDPVVREELARRFMPLVRRLASRYRGGREPLEDLVQVASLGLVKALDRFDPERGVAFTTYAAPTILGELRRHFRDRGWSVHVPRDLQERTAAVEKAIAEMPTRLGRSPSVREIAERLQLSDEDVLEAMEAGGAHHAVSMDALQRLDDSEGVPMVERMGDVDPGYETVEYGVAIEGVLDELSERDRMVLHLRFVEDLTQTQIAEKIGVSQMHVSRILRATLQRLRAAVPEEDE